MFIVWRLLSQVDEGRGFAPISPVAAEFLPSRVPELVLGRRTKAKRIADMSSAFALQPSAKLQNKIKHMHGSVQDLPT